MKWLKSEKGSTLMMVVITIAVIGTLGTALLAMSLMNVNMKYNDTRVKKTLYYAESGIDQVHARVGELVERAISESLVLTDSDLQTVLTTVDDALANGTASDADPYVMENELGDLILDVEELEVYADERFRYHFKYYLNNYPNDGVDFITQDIVTLNSDSGSVLSITVDSVDKFDNYTSAIDTFKFNDVTSTFIYKDRTEKVIQTDIEISADIAAYPIYTKEKHIILPDNPIWQQSIVANENITFQSTAVNIDGNLFGYGIPPSSGDDVKDFGGIIVSGSCNLDIDNGNVVTRNHLQLGTGAFNSASIDINNGMVYANSVVVQDRGNGVSSGDIRIVGNVYTSDDLELNGDGGSITIDGSFYGYTDGTDRKLSGQAVTHDYSSAIIVNANINSAGFGLDVEPLKSGGTPVANTNLDYNEAYEGILIGGTAYVNVSPTFRYQTAESVSIGGNFISYTWGYTQEILDLMIASNIFSNDPYNFYATGHDTRVQENLLSSNVDFVTVNGISLANGHDSATMPFPTYPWDLNDRKAYFAAFNDYIDTTDAFIKKGTPTNINLDDYIYTTGLHLGNVSGSNEFVNNLNSQGESELNYLRVSIRDDYKYLMNKMTHRGGGILSENMSDIEQVWSPSTGAEDGEVSNINLIEKYTTLDTESFSIKSLSATPTAMPSTTVDAFPYEATQDVIYIDDSTGNTLHIYPDGYAGSMESNHLQSSKMKGVIATNSNIEIHGDLLFYGPIITDGEIICYDGTQNLYNDPQIYTDLHSYLMDSIYQNDDLYRLFDVDTYAGIGTPSVNLGDIESIEVDTSQAYQPANNSAQNYHEYISFRHWSVVK